MTKIEVECPCGAKAVITDKDASRSLVVVAAFDAQHRAHYEQKPGGTYR